MSLSKGQQVKCDNSDSRCRGPRFHVRGNQCHVHRTSNVARTRCSWSDTGHTRLQRGIGWASCKELGLVTFASEGFAVDFCKNIVTRQLLSMCDALALNQRYTWHG